MSFLVHSPLFDLLLWVEEFGHRNVKPTDLSDGVVVADILHSLSPTDFSETWKNAIHVGTSLDSGRKAMNLDKIVGAISTFFAEVIDQPLSIAQLPDVTLIAELDDESELFRLLQLVLCCAVNCQNKETYIQAILNMEQSVQHSIMEAIQTIMSEIPSNKTKIAPHNCIQRCQELEAKVLQLESEKSFLQSEAEEMIRRLSSGEQNVSSDLSLSVDESHLSPIAGSEPGSIATKLQIRQLQQKLAGVRDELYHAEADHQETKLRLAETQATLADMKMTHDALLEKAREAKQLKDDLDIARDDALNARRLLASVDQWKKRAEEATALRVRCSKLEADNAACLELVAKLEQENRLSSNLRSQAESNRQQSAEAQSRASELLARAERAEASLDKMRIELQTAIQEKQIVTNEFNRLREQCDKFSAADSDAVVDTSSPFDDSAAHRALNLSLDSMTIEAENENHHGVASKLFDPAASVSSFPSIASGGRVTSAPPCVTTTTDTDINSDFAKTIAAKNEEIFQVEQRYRGYLAKTLEIIRCLDRRNNIAENQGGSADHIQPDPEIVRLQSLLVEKENIIEKLENHYETARRQRDIEERMVLTAWYHLGMRMKREEMMSRLHLQSEPQANSTASRTSENPCLIDESFLAGQRRVHLQSTPPQTRVGFTGP